MRERELVNRIPSMMPGIVVANAAWPPAGSPLAVLAWPQAVVIFQEARSLILPLIGQALRTWAACRGDSKFWPLRNNQAGQQVLLVSTGDTLGAHVYMVEAALEETRKGPSGVRGLG